MFFNKSKQGALLAKSEFPELGSVSEMMDKGPSAKRTEGAAEEVGEKYDFMSSARPMGAGGEPRD